MTRPSPHSPLSRTRPGSGIGSRYRALLLTHNSLEERLEAEMQRPLPDFGAVQRIKRRKLAIKDELLSIEGLLAVTGRGAQAPKGVPA